MSVSKSKGLQLCHNVALNSWSANLFLKWACLFFVPVITVAGYSDPAVSQQFFDSRYKANNFIQQQQDTTRIEKSPRSAMIRSLTIPGWGQWYNGKKIKSVLVLAGEVGIVTGIFVQHDRLKSATDAAEKEFFLDDRNKLFWWLGAAIIYSALDAFVDAYLQDFDVDMEVSSKSENDDQYTQITVTLPFSIFN